MARKRMESELAWARHTVIECQSIGTFELLSRPLRGSRVGGVESAARQRDQYKIVQTRHEYSD